jgi:hypothetical protein
VSPTALLRTWAINVALAAASLAIALGLLELWARHQAAYASSQIRSHGQLVAYSATLGWEKPAGEEAVYLHPEYQIILRVNSRGLRGPDRAYAKPPGVARVLLLGDSFVEGTTVGEESLVSTVLEERLNQSAHARYEVINGGTHGYGTDQEYLFFLSEGRRYQPDTVVLFFYSNDLGDNLAGVRKPFFELQEKNLVLRNSPVPPPRSGETVRRPTYERHRLKPFRGSYALRWLGDRLESALPRLHRRLARAGLFDRAVTRDQDVPPQLLAYGGRELGPEKKRMWRIAFALVEALASAVRADGARFIVFYVPARFEVNPSAWEPTMARWKVNASRSRPDRVFLVLQEECAGRGIELVDPRAALRLAEASSRPAYFVEDPHWSEVGHRIAAEALLPVLMGRSGAALASADARAVQETGVGGEGGNRSTTAAQSPSAETDGVPSPP